MSMILAEIDSRALGDGKSQRMLESATMSRPVSIRSPAARKAFDVGLSSAALPLN